jgi:hypothetical protein
MENIQFKFIYQIASIENSLDFYLKNKSRDCILFSEDGSKFKVHKELFGQTNFLREIYQAPRINAVELLRLFVLVQKMNLALW